MSRSAGDLRPAGPDGERRPSRPAPFAGLDELLQHLMQEQGSDLHVKVGSVPHVRIDGRLHPAPFSAPSPADIERIAYAILPSGRAEEFEATHEADFALSVPGVGRFRVNVHRQRGTVGLVFRRVPPGIPSFDALGLPPVVARLADEVRGLVLVTGPAGAGTTTTAAAMIDRINASRAANIVTIEDPIEVLHADKRALVNQREIGSDTDGFAEAMRRVLRQDPDVVFVGALRDPETVAGALAAAETGHLVLSTLHTTRAAEAIDRIVEFFPRHQHRQVRLSLATSLRGIVSQRLLDRADGRGRVPAVEVLVNTPKVFDRIVDPTGPGASLHALMEDGERHGMQTFDQSLCDLARQGLVSAREALAMATDPGALRSSLQHVGLAS